VSESGEFLVEANGVQLCAETFGARTDPAVLLVMGTEASMDWWDTEFCQRLAGGGRFVIRYDQRDTGQSIAYPPGEPEYTGNDLEADALGLLDSLALDTVHLVGMSSGGALAQVIALDHPGRIASLTLISTSFADRDFSHLPQMTPEGARLFSMPAPDWSSRAETVEHIVELWRACASPSGPFEEERVRATAERSVDRSRDVEASYTNHDLIDPGDAPSRRLEDLDIPALVIHGRDDPVFPIEHGVALRDAIPGARLLPLDRTGHELPSRVWDLVIPEMLALTATEAG
jgi:pimeloyl-ACP methyl ester carboxylesterase